MSEMTIARLDGWVLTAQPGARLAYGRGVSHATVAADLTVRARLLYDHGLVRLHHVRNGDAVLPFDFVAVRTTKPAPKGLAGLVPLRQPLAPTQIEPAVRARPDRRHEFAIGPGGRAW